MSIVLGSSGRNNGSTASLQDCSICGWKSLNVRSMWEHLGTHILGARLKIQWVLCDPRFHLDRDAPDLVPFLDGSNSMLPFSLTISPKIVPQAKWFGNLPNRFNIHRGVSIDPHEWLVKTSSKSSFVNPQSHPDRFLASRSSFVDSLHSPTVSSKAIDGFQQFSSNVGPRLGSSELSIGVSEKRPCFIDVLGNAETMNKMKRPRTFCKSPPTEIINSRLKELPLIDNMKNPLLGPLNSSVGCSDSKKIDLSLHL